MQDTTCMRFSHHLVKEKNYKYPRQLDGDSMYGDAGESLLYKLIKLFILFFFFSNIILLIFDAGVRPSLSWVWVSCDLNNKYKYRVFIDEIQGGEAQFDYFIHKLINQHAFNYLFSDTI